ncbi:MAG: ferrous iron transport protein A [Clostridia bacterium]|nr:ferrous iron transport protein A [Clostridia bacterium]
MSLKIISLDKTACGSTVKIISLSIKDDLRRRLMDLGLIEETTVKCIMKSPLGDPTAYSVRGAVIALRSCDASKILVKSE